MIKCIAVDDEPLALEQTVNYISRIPFLHLLASYNSAIEAMEILSDGEVDLLFLDIHMPGLSGIDLIRSLIVKPIVIFTTAHPQYAVDGFKVDATDYLLKPFDFHEFLRAADKARRQIETRSSGSEESCQDQLCMEDSLFVNTDSKIVRVTISDIQYIEAMSEYVRIHMEGETEPLVTLLSIRKFEERLPSHSFMRVHQLYIVNLQKITEVFRGSRIILGSDLYLPVGENYKKAFMEYLNKVSINK